MRELAARARDKKLTPAQMQGGVFTISSLGGIGGEGFTPIVNAPEVISLRCPGPRSNRSGMDRTSNPQGAAPVLSYDHRVINGGDAGRFLTDLVALLADVRRIILCSFQSDRGCVVDGRHVALSNPTEAQPPGEPMIIKPRVRGFLCTTTHEGCRENVRRQIAHVQSGGAIADGPKRVLVLGASTGYGLASRITAAFGAGAATIGVFFEKPGTDRKPGTAGGTPRDSMALPMRRGCMPASMAMPFRTT